MLSDMLRNEGIFHGNRLPSNEYFHFTRMEKLRRTIREKSIAYCYRKVVEEQSVVYNNRRICGLKILYGQLMEIMDLARSRDSGKQNTATQSRQCLPDSLKFIFLRRYNKLHQAISCMRAEQEGLWHRRSLKKFLRYCYLSYNPVDIESRIRKIVRKEEMILSFFRTYRIEPLILHYEDICLNRKKTLQMVFDFLEIEPVSEIRAETKYRKISGIKTVLIARSYRKYLTRNKKRKTPRCCLG